MNRHAQVRKMQARILQPQKERGVFCHADRERSLCIPSFPPSPGNRSFAGQGEGDAKMRNVLWPIHSLLLQPGKWQATGYGFPAVRWHGHPLIDGLQTGFSIERQLSCIFPAHLRSLARCLSRALRRVDVLLRSPRRTPFGSGFPKKNLAQRTVKIFLRSLRRKHISALGAGHLTSLRARVSRRQFGQIQTGEKQWHSTETTSR